MSLCKGTTPLPYPEDAYLAGLVAGGVSADYATDPASNNLTVADGAADADANRVTILHCVTMACIARMRCPMGLNRDESQLALKGDFSRLPDRLPGMDR